MTTTQTRDDLATRNAAVANAAYDSFNRGDVAAILAIAQPDVSITFVAWGTTAHGLSGLEGFLRSWKGMAPDAVIEVRAQQAYDAGVTNENVIRGTNTGPISTPKGVLPPTGRTFAVPFCEVLRLRDGRIAASAVYADMQTLLTQLGLG